MPKMEKFFSILPNEINLVFYGIDIVVDVRDGVHYIVDCNYLGAYTEVPCSELISALDEILRE